MLYQPRKFNCVNRYGYSGKKTHSHGRTDAWREQSEDRSDSYADIENLRGEREWSQKNVGDDVRRGNGKYVLFTTFVGFKCL